MINRSVSVSVREYLRIDGGLSFSWVHIHVLSMYLRYVFCVWITPLKLKSFKLKIKIISILFSIYLVACSI